MPRFFCYLLLAVLLPCECLTAEPGLPAYVLELPASVADVFVADTGNMTFHRFEHTNGAVSLADSSYMSIGENGVGKQRAWDRRTPLGIYFVVDQLETRRLHEKYGITAFPLDYPNVIDRQQQRGGDGIWVHGVLADGGRRPPLDTDGCLALPNENLRVLERRLVPLVTPVIVTREMHWQEPADRDALRRELHSAVRAWAAAIAASDLYDYFSLYSDDFSYRGLELNEWASLRLQTLTNRGAADVSIDELILLADPEEEGLYLARFRQTVASAAGSTVTTKRLYWKRNEDGALKIVAEDNG